MKSRQFKKAISSAFSLLLAIIMIFSISVPHVFAQSNMFAGTGDLEVGENETVDLLQGVAAASPTGENLQVTVKNVTCETNGNYQYDGSGVLNVGSGGSVYRIEYEAVSPTNAEERYSTTRKITVLPSETPISEETPETFAEEITEVTSEEITETLPEGVTEEASEEVPETLPEEITEEGLETLPEETTESVPEEVPEASPEDATETVPEEETQNSDTPELPEETTEEFTDGSTEETMEFDENVPFTLSDLEGMGYSVQMESAKIPIDKFELQCLYDEPGVVPCTDLHFSEGITTIDGGKIKEHVPHFVMNGDNKLHSYVKAHVGNVSVYYMGTLHIDNGNGTTENYVYYTTDTQITNKTVYAVLKEAEKEKITLTYSHESDYRIEYQMFEKDNHDVENGPDGWSYSDVFGEDRAIYVKKGHDAGITVKIPRGYKAEITIVRRGEAPEHMESLGRMMAYERDRNRINLKKDSPDRMIYETSFNLKNITSDVVITLEYEKVQQIHFNAYLWSQTAYAKDRIKIDGKNPTESNANLTTDGHSFVWEWDGVTTGEGPNGTGNGGATSHTWELDQLEINDEALIIPMVFLNDVGKTLTEKVTLASGTEVTLSVTSLGGTNAYDGKRHYKLEIANCYEDVTISGGNMVAHRHQEYAIRELFGVSDPGFYTATDAQGYPQEWKTMRQDTLIAKIGLGGKNKWTDPFRFKREVGYYKPDISFTTKEGTVLQNNYKIGYDEDNDGKPYIEYLIRTDGNTADPSAMGEYRVVSWDDWEASPDGYFYFRGSEEVKEFVGTNYTKPDWNPENAYKGVILVNINAHPIRIGLDYLDGADETGEKAPRAKNITNLPETQYGGPHGYNLVNNQRLLISNLKPVDLKNEFVFDHWEVMATDREMTDDKMWGYLTGEVRKDANGDPYVSRPGMEYLLDVSMLNDLENCFYMKADPGSGHTNGNPFNDKPHKGAQTHAIITVRAVWKKYESKPTIPYTVRYVTAEIKDGQIDPSTEKVIEERTHTVNKGAMLVTDLYQDGTKTPSASIQAVLRGENDAKEDYTNSGNVRWVVYEPKTTKMIQSVDMNNNVATIYLIKGNTKVNVEKAWTSRDHTEAEVNVQLQRRKTDAEGWQKVENTVLNEGKKWEHQFDVDLYYELPSTEKDFVKTWQYRVVEIDGNETPIEENGQMTAGENLYRVGYRFDTDKQAWVVENTRLLDLAVSKVVKGKAGDRTKEFVFDIQASDSGGKALNGDYSYIRSVKAGFDTQSQKPDDGTLTFQNGNAQIKLKHGQQIQIKNLPVNAQITVTEQSAEGYQTSYTVNGENKKGGSLTLIKHSTVDVVNEKSDIAATGITDNIRGIGAGLGMAAIAVLSFGGLALLRLKKGRKR